MAAPDETGRQREEQARAWTDQGFAQRELGRLADAERCFLRAIELQPDDSLAAAGLAGVQLDLGKVVEAEASLRAALERKTGDQTHRPLVVLLARLCRERGALEEAEQLYRRAIELAPADSKREWLNLGWVLSGRGETDAARDAYAHAQELDPDDLRARFARRLTLPFVYEDAAALGRARAAYVSGLEALEGELPPVVRRLSEQKLLDRLTWTNFLLAYQGLDDRELQERYARLIGGAIDAVAPQWRAPASRSARRGGRTRVGFASASFRVGTLGRYFRSWITDLDRERFEVFAYHLRPGMDEVASAIAQRADVFHSFAGARARPSVVASAIRADELDVLVYPELGSDQCCFVLAALRLAARQYAAWGHPVTTGHSTIDAFISCAAMEAQGAEAQYTERLVKLPSIGTCYKSIALPQDAGRERFGLPSGRVLLLCPQSAWKIHPDNDALFAELLAANRDAVLVLFSEPRVSGTDRLLRRLERVCAQHGLAVTERVRVLPWLAHEDYLRVNLVCDAMLDTLHWSGGNTSLDALACGLPIVTLPGAFMRGRQSAGMLGLLGVPELIAHDRSEYLAIAARLIGDAAWRREISARIRAARHRLFDVPDAIEALQTLLQTGDLPA